MRLFHQHHLAQINAESVPDAGDEWQSYFLFDRLDSVHQIPANQICILYQHRINTAAKLGPVIFCDRGKVSEFAELPT